ncbi:MAG: cyclic nucleotide-binding domain-containing protein [Methylotenera sp.]|nr:cyclic nucleotide-binding domain-containing protein [Oligoflexia bacterium]
MATPLRPSIQMLKTVKLLEHFSEGELGKLITLGRAAAFEAHTNIVIEGEATWGLYVILDGRVGIYKANQITGDMHDVAELSVGNFFGEMSLVDESPRSATVKAIDPCQVFYISKHAFMSFLNFSPALKFGFYETCVQELCARLRVLDQNYVVSQYQLWQTTLKKNKEAA